ncbi:MAG: HNH endonuclease [Thermodesulfobacteriota bacterium]
MDPEFQPKRLLKYDEEGVINEIKRVLSQHFNNQLPQMKDFSKYSRISYSTVLKYFGTWSNALEKSGYRFSDDALQDLKKVAALNNGKFFTYKFYKKNGGRYSSKMLKKYLGCSDWQTLLEKNLSLKKIRIVRIVTAQRKRKSLFTEEQLFLELDRVWKELGRRPTYTEFRKTGNIGTKVYERRFGSWTKAIESFSLKFGYFNQSNENCRVTSELVLAELKSIASKIPYQRVKFDDYEKFGGVHSLSTFYNCFGSWAKAVQKIDRRAGVEKGLYSDEDMFSELQRIWEILGRQPKYREMGKSSSITASLYIQRFGSWIKAVHAFCKDRAEENERENEDVADNMSANKERIETIPDSENASSDKVETIVMSTPRQAPPKLRFKVMARDKFTCVTCGRGPKNESGVKLHVDHIHPYSKGGETVFKNLQTLCQKCNMGKSNLIFD